MKRVVIALLTIAMTSGVALFWHGTSGVAYAAELPAETSGVADTSEVPEETSEVPEETSEVPEETSGVADTSEVIETEVTETSGVARTAKAADEEPADTSGVIVVELNSGAERNGEFITVNEEFQTESESLALIMSGLKEGNKEALLNALSEKFDPNGDKGVKVIDAAFADAEKWNDDVGDATAYDAGQCWAATASNMLWVSGWAERFVNPATGANFASEDEVFELFNTSFTDSGSEVSSGIDWFLMGEYYATDIGTHADLINKETGGYLKTFVSTLAQHRYAMAEDAGYISQLERIDASSEKPAVFQLSLGSLDDGVLSTSIHSVTLAGVIIDPNTTSLENRYKGIAIVNSDDDAVPSEAAQQIADPTFEQKQADKAARPNSCTFYPLRHTYDANGTPCWEIVGFSDEETAALYAINALELASDDLIAKYTETEGNCSVADTVDLTLESVITTDETEPITDYWHYSIFAKDYKCNEFSADEPINLNYFVINRTKVIMDTEYKGGKDLSVNWKVTKDSDGSVVAEGTSIFEENVYSGSESGAMIHLNEQDGGLAKWEAGTYTATISLNPDRAIREAYYLNNVDQSVQFTVVAAEEEEEKEETPAVDPESKDDPEPKDEPESKDEPAEESKEDPTVKPEERSEEEKPAQKPEEESQKESEKFKNKEESESKPAVKPSESSSESKTGGKTSSTYRDDTNTGDTAAESAGDYLFALIVAVIGILTVLRKKNRASDF